MPMPRQSPLVRQGVTAALALQVRRMSHGPEPTHWPSVSHTSGTPGRSNGKYWIPTPRPADFGSPRNVVSAVRTASHFVWLPATVADIEPELSIMM